MSAKDKIHDAIKTALIKDGWQITHDPYTIEYEGEFVYADLGAERTLAAERAGQKIIVEIKSFTGRSAIQDFKTALGQYVLYLALVTETAPDYKVYLAISDITYATDFQLKMIQLVVQRDKIPVIVVNLDTAEVIEWIN